MNIQIESLVPAQIRIGLKDRQKADYFEQKMLKHPMATYFLSRLALLYAGLLEGEPEVISYVPYPFRIRFGKLLFKPDFYVSRRVNDEVVFFHSLGKTIPFWFDELSKYLNQNNIGLAMIDPPDVFSKEIEAENWLEVVRRLSNDDNNLSLELSNHLMTKAMQCEFFTIGEVIDRSDRNSSLEIEITLLILIIRGKLNATIQHAPLSYDTRISIC